jgi:hypothetical protein
LKAGKPMSKAFTGCPEKLKIRKIIPFPNGSVGYVATERSAMRKIGTKIGISDFAADGNFISECTSVFSVISSSEVLYFLPTNEAHK